MKSKRQLKAMKPRDRVWSEMVDSLWRELYGLYNEKYEPKPELDEFDQETDPWKRNSFADKIKFGQAIGQDNFIAGNKSIAIGQGAVTKSFMEFVLGSYNVIPEGQNAEEWIPTDLLMTLGNGPDEAHRSVVFEIFKSGLIRLQNAIKLGEFDNGGLDPQSGSMQFKLNKFQGYLNDAWHDFLTDAPKDNHSYARNNGDWIAIDPDKYYRHTQLNPSRVWEVNHNLNKYPSVTIIDSEGNEYESDVRHLDENNLIINFSVAFSGFADLN